MAEKDIGKIKKGEYQGSVTEIVIGIREYNGKVGVDIREFVSGGKYTGPTKKGLRIPAESFSEFKEMINSIHTKDLESSGSSGSDSETKSHSHSKAPSQKKLAKEETEDDSDDDESEEEMPDY